MYKEDTGERCSNNKLYIYAKLNIIWNLNKASITFFKSKEWVYSNADRRIVFCIA